MLTSLSIKNFALIEQLSIDFSDGFSTITGETGAGKSILLGALGLVLGKRADLTSLKHKDEKCVIEAHFDISKYQLHSFFEDNDMDYEGQTILRREILPSGKSRAFVNDSPVNLQELQELGFYLIDIHSQNQTQELSETSTQFVIIDAIAGNQALILEYESLLKNYKNDKNQLSSLLLELKEANKEQDYTIFLLNELVAAKLLAGSQEDLESTFEQLNNVEFIKENIEKAIAFSEIEPIGVIQNLKEIKVSLQKVATISKEFENLYERINSIVIEFDDIVSELNSCTEKLLDDPKKLELINEKLQSIYSLQKKHQVKSVDELLIIQRELESKVRSVDDFEMQIKKIEATILKTENELDKKATLIHQNRIGAVPIFITKSLHILEQLGMTNARFLIEIEATTNYYSNGKDTIQFLFAANKGSDFGLLKKVASGGEMSRIMLATKAILADYSKLPTIIFDEIDTGVSGEIANKMAAIMSEMSQNRQVFSITHLPQIASKGKMHYKVFKYVSNNQTQTELKILNYEERVIEIAEMLSGASPSDSAIIHAKALLN